MPKFHLSNKAVDDLADIDFLAESLEKDSEFLRFTQSPLCETLLGTEMINLFYFSSTSIRTSCESLIISNCIK